jgi:hypothetical protein
MVLKNVIWRCECKLNIGAWESKSIKEASITAHWACENADIIASCSATIDNRKYKVNIKLL